MGPRMITIVTAQELRVNLGADAKLDSWIDRCIAEIERWFVKPDLLCVMETVGLGGEILDHFDGRTLNPGHAIEGAWFILHEGKHRKDSRLIKLGLPDARLDVGAGLGRGVWRHSVFPRRLRQARAGVLA